MNIPFSIRLCFYTNTANYLLNILCTLQMKKTKNKANPRHVCMSHPEFAKTAVQLLADKKISRSAIVKKLMSSLGRGQPQPHTMQFIKDLLLKRELGDNGKEKFSCFIEDIEDRENISEAVSVMETASEIFEQDPYFPQTVSRLCYIRQKKSKITVTIQGAR